MRTKHYLFVGLVDGKVGLLGVCGDMRWHYSVNTAGVLDPSMCSSRARVGLDGGLTASLAS